MFCATNMHMVYLHIEIIMKLQFSKLKAVNVVELQSCNVYPFSLADRQSFHIRSYR